MVAALCLSAGMAHIARLRPSFFTQERHGKQACQHLLSGTSLPVQNIGMPYLSVFHRTLNVLYNVFVTNYIFKTSHVVFPL